MNADTARASIRPGDSVGTGDEDGIEWFQVIDLTDDGLVVWGALYGPVRQLRELSYEAVDEYQAREIADHPVAADVEDVELQNGAHAGREPEETPVADEVLRTALDDDDEEEA